MPRIAVLMTCHNRRDLTLAAVRGLARQDGFAPEGLFLVDDGSTDGTGDAVRTAMPGANVIEGDGSLFWNGGMRLAWDSAKAAGGFDFYLWLNDDVVLADGTIAMLLADAARVAPDGGPVIVSAATVDPGDAACVTYGGQIRPDPSRPLRFSVVRPGGAPIPLDTISGNIVLVSAAAERSLGNIAPHFAHIYGDLDYGLRAGRAGVPMVLASRVGGTCALNSDTGTSLDPALPMMRRLRLRWREDGRMHARDWRTFVRLHGRGPVDRVLHCLSPYLRIVLDRPHRPSSAIVDR